MSLEFGTNCRSFAVVPDAELSHEVRKKAKLVRVIVCATESVIENINYRQKSTGMHLSVIENENETCATILRFLIIFAKILHRITLILI